MCVRNKDGSPVGIDIGNSAPAPTDSAEFSAMISQYFTAAFLTDYLRWFAAQVCSLQAVRSPSVSPQSALQSVFAGAQFSPPRREVFHDVNETLHLERPENVSTSLTRFD